MNTKNQYRFFEDRIEKLLCADQVERDIHIWEAGKPKGVLIAIHGALAHGGDYCTMAKSFNNKQWHMLSFDMRGHNVQRRVHFNRFDELLDDLALFIKWTKKEYPHLPVFIVGHSMGGLLTGLYALHRETTDDEIQGYVLSAPYWANAVPVPAILKLLAGVLSTLLPRARAPLEDFLDVLTHDANITERHKQDEADDIRAREVSFRFANEMFNAHKNIDKNIAQWRKPLFIAIAGDDKLTDSKKIVDYLGRINSQFVEAHRYANNFHENFNETNRETIFNSIEVWLDKQLVRSN